MVCQLRFEERRQVLDGKLSFALDFKKHESLVVQGIFKDGKLAGECHHPQGPTYKWEAIRK
jgi:hypothetical protein